MKKTAFIALLVAGFLYLSSAKEVLAQFFSFDPASLTKNVGEQFTVVVNIDTGGKQVKGADAKISFDPAIIEVVSIEKGTFFPKGGYNIDTDTGKIYLSYGFDQALLTDKGTGSYATLTLKGKKVGTGNLTWVCSAQTSDTNIWDVSSNDIVNCTLTTNGVYTIVESGSSTSPTVTPGLTGNPTAVPSVPVTGIVLPTFLMVSAGVLLTIVGLALTI